MTETLVQLLRFGLVGLANTALGLAVILGLMHLAGLHPVPANVAGYAAGLCLSFFANGRWTFQSRVSGAAGLRFLLAFGLSYLANLGVLLFCLEYTSLPPTLAQITAMAVYTLLFFALGKLYVYD